MITNSQTSLFRGFLCRHVSPLCLLEQWHSSHSQRSYLEHGQKYQCSCANHSYPTREMYIQFQYVRKTPNIYLQLFHCCNNCLYPSSSVSDYFDAVHVGQIPAVLYIFSQAARPAVETQKTARWVFYLSDHQTDFPDAAACSTLALFQPQAV